MNDENMNRINGNTKVFGIMGYPVGHSMSPAIHNAAFQEIAFNGVYVPFPVHSPPVGFLETIASLSIQGLSVTIPHKEWAARNCHSKDSLTELCGAANTLILQKDGKLKGYNTDGPGALRALKSRNSQTINGKYLILGYGGSAMAIAHTILLEESPSFLGIAGRNPEKKESLVRTLKEKHPEKKDFIQAVDFETLKKEDVNIIIHTTPLGMTGQEQSLPLPEDYIDKNHTVFDIVYNPMDTQLLEHAREKGALTVPGYLMLLYQGVIQFELFTGEQAPEERMEQTLLKALQK